MTQNIEDKKLHSFLWISKHLNIVLTVPDGLGKGLQAVNASNVHVIKMNMPLYKDRHQQEKERQVARQANEENQVHVK